MRILRTLAVICIAGWLAISSFFSFAVAPLVFKTIDRAVAGQVVSVVLPRYYDWGLVLCGIALIVCALRATIGGEGRGPPPAPAPPRRARFGPLVSAPPPVLSRPAAA